MLIELRVRDYAVIDDLSLELKPGLNVLSGETGAGKSLIVGALSLLVGERASSQTVRKGAAKAVVEAAFDLSKMPGMEEQLSELGFPEEDGLLLLKREVASEGRNRAWVNGSPATASSVGALGARLLDIHGQHEHQSLLEPKAQRRILDVYSGASETADRVEELFRQLAEERRELADKKARLTELESRAEFLRFQLSEIDGAKLDEDEEEALEEEARRLDHAEELALGARSLHEALYGGEDSLTDRVASLRGLLAQLAKLDPSLGEEAGGMEEAYHLLTETGRKLGSYAAGLEFDPGRLEEIRMRQDLLFRLKRKYGPTVADILATGKKVSQELSELDGAAFDLEGLERTIDHTRVAFLRMADDLTNRRQEGARRLESAVGGLLPELGLEKGRFRVDLTPLEEPGSYGAEGVAFLVSLNPGFDPGPLSRVASGGELSRVMLALKNVLAGVDRIPTLIFDEIDAGIGGEVALRVANRLKAVARHHQVFVVTHLPQLASKAHQQILVEKTETEGMASTRVRELQGEERVMEVARMLGGDAGSAASRDHARELLGG
ncbi:MAG: DNA repair protein RecN [Gemmatimonadota bacterium]|jgi:DNA repair protein RecN (Recombination protein N)